jgi:phytoene dehydrogenase-like protein
LVSAPDHIILGSGINALVCAAMLAGGKGLMLERNDRIGSCSRTEEITDPGFIHDVMATTFVLFATSTEVEGLYHIGASTHPGAGLGGGSGFLLAQRL